MIPIFNNLKFLRQDMKNKGWVVSPFLFEYNKQRYIVIVRLLKYGEYNSKYALLELLFLNEYDFADNLLVEANSSGLLISAKELREFFKIAYSDNLGDILKQFNEHLATFIPTKTVERTSARQKQALVFCLNKSDSEDPNKIYCTHIRRNPPSENGSLGQRSPFNDNKTRILRPTLYQRLSADTNLSFCYSDNPSDENTDEVIVAKWLKNITAQF